MVIYILALLLCLAGIIYFLTGIFEHLITRKFFKSQMRVFDVSDCQFEPVYTDDIDVSFEDKEN